MSVRCCLISAARQSTLSSKALHQRHHGTDTRDVVRRDGAHGTLAGNKEDVARHRGHQAARNLIAIRLPPLSPTEAGLLADADGFLDVI